MPFKPHAQHRHHIPKPRYRVTNWPEYDAALRQRGSLTVWFTDEAIAAWQAQARTTPGGQSQYSRLAITTALALRAVFGLALWQTEGLIGSIIALLGLDLAAPDHSTLSRRTRTLPVPLRRRLGTGPLHLLMDSTGVKLGSAGEWQIEKQLAVVPDATHLFEEPGTLDQVIALARDWFVGHLTAADRLEASRPA